MQFTHILCNKHSPASLQAYFALVFGPPVLITIYFTPWPLHTFFLHGFRCLILYTMSLLASVITYRLSPFHPLARFPGPWQARITRMWGIKAIIGKQQHRHSHELFLKYGDVVRTGPDHLLFRDPDAISVVLGPTNPWPKGASTCSCASCSNNGLTNHDQDMKSPRRMVFSALSCQLPTQWSMVVVVVSGTSRLHLAP
jgi:hypothetical protein